MRHYRSPVTSNNCKINQFLLKFAAWRTPDLDGMHQVVQSIGTVAVPADRDGPAMASKTDVDKTTTAADYERPTFVGKSKEVSRTVPEVGHH
jgi:hypothetical protein